MVPDQTRCVWVRSRFPCTKSGQKNSPFFSTMANDENGTKGGAAGQKRKETYDELAKRGDRYKIKFHAEKERAEKIEAAWEEKLKKKEAEWKLARQELLGEMISYLLFDAKKELDEEEEVAAGGEEKKNDNEEKNDNGEKGDDEEKGDETETDKDKDSDDTSDEEEGGSESNKKTEEKVRKPRDRKHWLKKMLSKSAKEAARTEGHILFKSFKYMNVPTMAQKNVLMQIYERAGITDEVKMVRYVEGLKVYVSERYSDMKRSAKAGICEKFMGKWWRRTSSFARTKSGIADLTLSSLGANNCHSCDAKGKNVYGAAVSQAHCD